jgi:predicted PurR-regulated permease PerM
MMSEHNRQIEQVGLVSIIALLLFGSIVMLLPFLRAILAAVVFGVAFWPLFLRVEKTLKGRSSLAAMVPTLLLAVILFLPVAFISAKLVAQAPIAVDYGQALMEKGLGSPPPWLHDLPLVGEKLEALWQDTALSAQSLIEIVKPHVGVFLASLLSAGSGISRFLLTAILALIVLFFLLKEGRAIHRSLETMALRLGGEKGSRLLAVAGATMRSVVYGILFAAMLQGILSVFGLWISGVPRAVFLGTAAGILALIPIGVIQLVLLPAAGWLFYQGHTGWGIFLLVWSVGFIGQVDNVIRPMMISRGAKVPFLVILLGVLGGLAFGGVVGLFVGATLLAVVYTMLKEWGTPQEEDPGDARRTP